MTKLTVIMIRNLHASEHADNAGSSAEQAMIYEQGASERRRVTRSALSSSGLLFSTHPRAYGRPRPLRIGEEILRRL
jgi:hypothetical protein